MSYGIFDVIQKMATVIAERGGFVPVIIKDTDDKIGVVTGLIRNFTDRDQALAAAESP